MIQETRIYAASTKGESQPHLFAQIHHHTKPLKIGVFVKVLDQVLDSQLRGCFTRHTRFFKTTSSGFIRYPKYLLGMCLLYSEGNLAVNRFLYRHFFTPAILSSDSIVTTNYSTLRNSGIHIEDVNSHMDNSLYSGSPPYTTPIVEKFEPTFYTIISSPSHSCYRLCVRIWPSGDFFSRFISYLIPPRRWFRFFTGTASERAINWVKCSPSSVPR